MRTPQETFLSDQALAAAREAAADPTQLVVALTAADGKQQCSWCECPIEAHLGGGRCAGCPATAVHVVSVFAGQHVRYDYPSCERHHTDVIAQHARVVSQRNVADG